MVQFTTCHITRRASLQGSPLLFVWILFSSSLQADFWDDALGVLKTAGNKIEDGFVTAGKEIAKGTSIAIDAIKDRFKDTKTTRSIDYGIRKAALETALATANGILEGAKQASSGTLVAAEETAKAGLTAAEHFLSDVVRAGSSELLKGSAQAAQTTLEGVKQAGIGVLQGTKWVVNQTSQVFDINRVTYNGDLQRLMHGVLGDVACEGTAFGKQFSFHFDLDPHDLKSVQTSIEKLLKDFERLFNDNVTNPLKKAFSPLHQQAQQVEKVISLQDSTSAVLIKQAIEASKKASELANKLGSDEQKMGQGLKNAAGKLDVIALANDQALKELIRQGVKTSSAETVSARQELIRRLKATKK